VVLAPQILDNVVELGVIPVGAPKARSPFVPLTEPQWASIAEVDWTSPNYERILRLHPDLILTSTFSRPQYAMLSRIAPVEMVDISVYGDVWRGRFTAVAKALGREEQGRQMMARYEAHAARVRQELASRKLRVTVMTATTEAIAVEPPNYFCWDVLKQAGVQSIPYPKINGKVPKMITWISWERLPELDSDALFVAPAGFGGEERTRDAMRELREQPLWSGLSAVQRGRVYTVGAYWLTGGPTSAERILDDLEHWLKPGAAR
jgi:iron complex transport system substrate-binding protein